ncbi:hypothetical protein BHM03_00037428 [Ensete ventricosum]|nr:hypothetical protein BHM03_00037428 [Ensete ventricosum]
MLPLSSTDRSDVLASVRNFFPLLQLSSATPSTIVGEDCSFLYHRRTPLKLPPPATLPSTTSDAAAGVIRHCRCYRP